MQKDASNADVHSIQLGMSLLHAVAQVSRESNQIAIAGKLEKQLKDYENKFAPVMGKPQD
jgi:hypothetical protein